MDTAPKSTSDRKGGDSTNTDQAGSSDAVKKRKIDWPIIRTQHELTDLARLQRKGENIYPLQGREAGEILMHYGVIDEHTLRIVQTMQKRPDHKNKPVGEILIEIGIIKQEELTRTLLIQEGIPMVDVLSIEIPPELNKIISQTLVREKLAQPVGLYDDTLYLVVSNPFSFADQSFLALKTGLKIKLAYAPTHEIVNRINLHGVIKKGIKPTKEETQNQGGSGIKLPENGETASGEFSDNDPIIVDLVNQTLLKAIREEASDIHIELFNDGQDARIRIRRDGKIENLSDYSRAYHKAVVSRIKIMSGLDIAEKKRPQEGKLTFGMPDGGQFDLKVAITPAMSGIEFITIRISTSGKSLPLGSLGLSNRDTNVLGEILQRPYGLVLVCGPSDSGKTTTLHSMLGELNTEDRKIWTAEDPVEIVQPHLCQVQVNSKIGMTFAPLLRSFLRADPDVIMIGEIRDQEIAKIALEASMTGHLVLSTLRTRSASETVNKLLNLDIDPYDLSDSLLGILAQRLVRKLCPACAGREECSAGDIEDLASEYYQSAHSTLPTPAERSALIQSWREKFGMDGKLYLRHAVGCELCRGGYKGHIGLYELLNATPALRHLIRQRSAASEYLSTGVADGMKTLKQDGIEKVIRGITDMVQVHGACI